MKKLFTCQTSIYCHYEWPVMALSSYCIGHFVQDHAGDGAAWTTQHCVHDCYGNGQSVALLSNRELWTSIKSQKANKKNETTQRSDLSTKFLLSQILIWYAT